MQVCSWLEKYCIHHYREVTGVKTFWLHIKLQNTYTDESCTIQSISFIYNKDRVRCHLMQTLLYYFNAYLKGCKEAAVHCTVPHIPCIVILQLYPLQTATHTHTVSLLHLRAYLRPPAAQQEIAWNRSLFLCGNLIKHLYRLASCHLNWLLSVCFNFTTHEIKKNK